MKILSISPAVYIVVFSIFLASVVPVYGVEVDPLQKLRSQQAKKKLQKQQLLLDIANLTFEIKQQRRELALFERNTQKLEEQVALTRQLRKYLKQESACKDMLRQQQEAASQQKASFEQEQTRVRRQHARDLALAKQALDAQTRETVRAYCAVSRIEARSSQALVTQQKKDAAAIAELKQSLRLCQDSFRIACSPEILQKAREYDRLRDSFIVHSLEQQESISQQRQELARRQEAVTQERDRLEALCRTAQQQQKEQQEFFECRRRSVEKDKRSAALDALLERQETLMCSGQHLQEDFAKQRQAMQVLLNQVRGQK